MKKLLIPFCIIIAFQLSAQDDDGYVMFQTIQLKALKGHQQELREGLKAHNEKFHTGGMDAVGVWNIRSGPNATGLSWVKGPLTWSSLDTELSEDHMEDWLKNVDAHANVGAFEFWRLVDGMTYAPEGFQTKVMRVRWFELLPGKQDDAREVFEKLIQVFQQHKFNRGLHVYSNQTDAGDGRQWALLTQFSSWADMDENLEIGAKYDALHGEDSWNEFFRDLSESTIWRGTQLNSLNENLSTPPE